MEEIDTWKERKQLKNEKSSDFKKLVLNISFCRLELIDIFTDAGIKITFYLLSFDKKNCVLIKSMYHCKAL